MTNPITTATRAAAYQAVLPLAANRQEKVYEILRAIAPAGLTAGEIAELSTMGLNNTRSALTELMGRQRIVVIGKRISAHADAQRKTKVAVWALPRENK